MQSIPLRATLAALAGALLVALLAGVLYLTAGLLVVAAVVGWGTGVAVREEPDRGRRRALAVGAALGAVVLGLLGAWAYARSTGGTLDPLGFVVETMGLLAPLQLLVAGIAAARSAR